MNGSYAVHPSEGGHTDFAPADGMQYALLQYLQQRHGHVSYERIVSGPGLVAIFEFLRDSGQGIPSSHFIEEMREGDGAATITRFAQQGNEPIARMTVDLFVRIYGAFVGNLALLALPRGGIYVQEGLQPKLPQSCSAEISCAPFLQRAATQDCSKPCRSILSLIHKWVYWGPI